MKKEEEITHCPKCKTTKDALFFYRAPVDGKERLILRCRNCDYAKIIDNVK